MVGCIELLARCTASSIYGRFCGGLHVNYDKTPCDIASYNCDFSMVFFSCYISVSAYIASQLCGHACMQ